MAITLDTFFPAPSGGGDIDLSNIKGIYQPSVAPEYTKPVDYVSVGSGGDYADIFTALGASERKLYLLDGTNVVNNQFLLTYDDEIRIMGQSKENTIIDIQGFNGTPQSYSFITPDGTALGKFDVGVYRPQGLRGSKKVTFQGSISEGPATALAPGQYIEAGRYEPDAYSDKYFIKIVSVDSTSSPNSITLEEPLPDDIWHISGNNFCYIHYPESILDSNITIQNLTVKSTVNDGFEKYLFDSDYGDVFEERKYLSNGIIQDVNFTDFFGGAPSGDHDAGRFIFERCRWDQSSGEWLEDDYPPQHSKFIDCEFNDFFLSGYGSEGSRFINCKYTGDPSQYGRNEIPAREGNLFEFCEFDYWAWSDIYAMSDPQFRPNLKNCIFPDEYQSWVEISSRPSNKIKLLGTYTNSSVGPIASIDGGYILSYAMIISESGSHSLYTGIDVGYENNLTVFWNTLSQTGTGNTILVFAQSK